MSNLVQQAGIHCSDPEFHEYFMARQLARSGRAWDPDQVDAELVAGWVRLNCGIRSRSELNRNHQAARMWKRIVQDYRKWKKRTGRFDRQSTENGAGDERR